MKKNLIILLLALLITSGCENKSVLNQINEIESLTHIAASVQIHFWKNAKIHSYAAFKYSFSHHFR